MMEYTLWYLLGGVFAGLMSGLFGIGGGIVVVPVLNFIFHKQSVPLNQIQHLALGTSLASIIFTSLSSLRAQHKLGAVRWDYWKKMTPGLLLGTFIGSIFANFLSTKTLEIIFICFLIIVGTQLILSVNVNRGYSKPGFFEISIFSIGIGGISSLVGIGGGTLSVPFLLWCSLTIHNAIGTSSAISFPIALGGTISYMYIGWGAHNLPIGSIGYVNIKALFWIVLSSILTAPIGVKLSHKLSSKVLKRTFGFIAYGFAFHMLWNSFL